MNLSLEDVLAFPIFETAKIISGKNELGAKTVEWVSVIESPVENFVRENELVLSTGIGCYTDPHLFFDFVKDVYESGASALAIATGHYIYRIPEEIVDFAQKNKFVMIDLPWEVRFADIIHELTSAINRLQQDELLRLKEVQQELIEMYLTKKPFSSIVSVIEKELGLPVLVMNNKGNVAGGSAKLRDVWRMWNDMKTSEEAEESHHPIFSKMKQAESKDAQLFHMNIQSSEQNQGDFFVVAPPSYKMKLREANLIEQAVMVCALWLTSENAVAENKNIRQKEFVLSLTREDEASEQTIREEAQGLGFDIDLPYECLIGYPENLESLFYQDPNHNHQTKKSWLDKMMAYIEMELADAAQSIQRQVMYAREDDKMIIFLQASESVTQSSSNGTVNQFLDLVDRRLNKLLPGVVVSWGIGKHADGVMSFYRSYNKAASALEVGRKQKGTGKRYHFDNTKISRLILNLSKNEEVQEITMSTISPLVEYDEKREMDLINTFIVYNENAGNVSQAARVLNLHRQSLLYRLRKIESLTNLSLTNPDDVFLLDFSIKIWMSSGNRIDQHHL
ncbi:PucR family transcriptional regulator [Siminovitchia fortis]|uniref:PucR family transcriptional regulator n=1 Tax=Siminovitchia fortis TaxID=254758 RepID=A0A443IV87_9BACI|nr:PucR family transcriptional regulator [Siminovitchia fortis]RWR11972.1 PucR family transcriptional regulator [Siminovitchia fortis]WHY80765.1 PucR family transcriptional regulator ligand-binding domain-containing protein [Siminovitchia fortis]